jgi:hypothetical protein
MRGRAQFPFGSAAIPPSEEPGIPAFPSLDHDRGRRDAVQLARADGSARCRPEPFSNTCRTAGCWCAGVALLSSRRCRRMTLCGRTRTDSRLLKALGESRRDAGQSTTNCRSGKQSANLCFRRREPLPPPRLKRAFAVQEHADLPLQKFRCSLTARPDGYLLPTQRLSQLVPPPFVKTATQACSTTASYGP